MTILVPESRAAQRPGLDLVGVAASAAGLVAVTYGLIQASQDGWSDIGALALMIAGVALLVGFFGWERRLTRRPGGQPLIDLSLFSSASFTWGVILAVVPIMAMLGILSPRSCTRRRCSPRSRRLSCTAWTWHFWRPPASPWRASSSP